MGMDVTVKRVKEIRCPDCGKLVDTAVCSKAYSSGCGWRDILEEFGYYVPYEERNESNGWYAKDMVLTMEQTIRLMGYVAAHNLQDWLDIVSLISVAIGKDERVVINADW